MSSKLKPPSRHDSVGSPIFGLYWYGDPGDGTSILAYCGGGGSSATGVKNRIFVEIARGPEDKVQLEDQPQGGANDDEPVIIDTADQLGVAVHICKNPLTNKLSLFCALGTKINVYSLPECQLEQELSVGATVHTIGVNAMANAIALGCDNGSIKVFEFERDYRIKELPAYVCDEGPDVGHTKPICSVSFAPRKNDLLCSSSKDGTARVWNRDQCISVLKCSIQDPTAPPPPANRRNRIQTVMVRGCAFGDLEGNLIYTVASGKRGKAFLSKWGFDERENQYQCFERTVCSEHPVSAMSMSADASTIAIGNSDGNVYLWSIPKWKTVKKFPGVHEFPVTCIASRPYDLPLKGEQETQIRFNAFSASADAQLARLTTQRKVPKSAAEKNAPGFPLAEYLNWLTKWALILLIVSPLAQDMWVRCGDDSDIDGFGAKLKCVRDNIIIAPSSRPGISIPPH
mmetsp:Transcript_8928/g.22079  ORF Transcript_8928/g.22079 Transcript_8928/m.22079 type:complete len:457 (-) Transcript_8928:2270-3640(-)